MLSIEALTYPASGPAIVDDVTFHARPGARTALHGRSGAGKTTILKLLAGVLPAARGRMLIDNKPLVQPGRPSDAILVWQDQVLFEHMSVAENVGFGLVARGVARQEIKARTSHALVALDLAGYEDRRPPSLSGGERARIAFARAFVVAPRVLLVDEVFANVDRRSRSLIFSLLDDFLAKEQRYAIYVSHSFDDLISYADDLIVLDHGHVCELGSLQSVLESPKTAQGALVPTERIGLAGRVTAIGDTEVEVSIDDFIVSLTKASVVGSICIGAQGTFVFSQTMTKLVQTRGRNTFPTRVGKIIRLSDAQKGMVVRIGTATMIVPIEQSGPPGIAGETTFVAVEGFFYINS